MSDAVRQITTKSGDSTPEGAAPNRSLSGTMLGLPTPGESDVSMPVLQTDSAPQLRSTRPAWIDAALAQGDQASVKTQGERIHLVPGAQIPGTRYRIERWLGDGGMGQVYEATHVDLERRVAIKVLRHEASALDEATQMFRQEARRAGKIGSRYIAEVYDFAELPDGRLMFAMELLDGRSVASELRHGPIEAGRAIGLLRQVCKGLHAAHRAKIIHRDVKPENIMLSSTGRTDEVKILDFGISTVYDDSENARGSTAGTAHYIAPELVSGIPYGPRVDMYALGCTAYEMLTGRTPFEADSVEQMLLAHVQTPPTPMAKRNPAVHVPAALERVVLRCMAKRAADRFGSMAELEAALCEAQIEAALHSTWDDLPLPDVDEERRAALLAGMPDLHHRKGARARWVWPLVTAASVTLALGLGYVALSRSQGVSAEQVSEIETLTRSARTAAARAMYVYPPSSQPDAQTAYGQILALEALASGEAVERADDLRRDFADTLIRLGDQYWAKAGGKPFSLDYYAQALVFDPDRVRAAERAQMTPGQLRALTDKAAGSDFSEGELIAAEPLAALAEADADARLAKMEALRAEGKVRSAVVSEQLDALIEDEGGKSADELARERRQARADRAAAVQTTRPQDTDTEASAEADDVSEVDDQDPQRSRDLSKQGWAALAKGQLNQAEPLFRDALAVHANNAEAHDGLAKISFDRSNYAQALRSAKRAVRFAPRNADYRIRLGDSYYKLFRYADALIHYERADELGHRGAARRAAKARANLGNG